MKLIQPTFEILDQEPGLTGIYKAIEYPGRICYGSTDKITEDSAEEFLSCSESSETSPKVLCFNSLRDVCSK